MAVIETLMPFGLTDYEEAAYLLSKYFIQRGYEAETYKCKDAEGGYAALISRKGFLKNLLGSRTTIEVSFYPYKYDTGQEGSAVRIRSGIVKDGVIKELLTYLTVLPAIRKVSDYVSMLDAAKKRSVYICESLKITVEESGS